MDSVEFDVQFNAVFMVFGAQTFNLTESDMRVCTKALSCVAVDNYYVVTTDCDLPIRIYFMTKDIVRIRAGFDGDFH